MGTFAAGLLVAFLIVDSLLFLAIRKHYSEIYEKLGRPNFFSLGANPVTILKCLLFIFGTNPFKRWSKMTLLFRATQFLFVGFLFCMIAAIVQ